VIDRRRLLAGTAGSWLVASRANAQPVERVFKVGYLGQGTRARELNERAAFGSLVRNLAALGYVEGANLAFETRFADGRPDSLNTLAAQLVQARPDVIAVPSAGLARAVLEHTATIPVVALAAGQLEADSSVQSLAKPGGNLTGMQIFSNETMGKRLQLLQEVIPHLRRAAVLRGVPFEGPGFELYRDATEAAAASLGIRVRLMQFRDAGELKRLFDEMLEAQDQALLTWSNPHLNEHRQQIHELSMRQRLPTISDVRTFDLELLVYAAKIGEVWREAATYVDRILKGAKAGNLPIGQARSFELVVNLKIAQGLGVSIPRALLLRADEVIQ
jgi:putative ABC transport system substrate-binding protein